MLFLVAENSKNLYLDSGVTFASLLATSKTISAVTAGRRGSTLTTVPSMKIAGSIIVFLIVGQLTAAPGNVEIKFVVQEAQVEKATGALGLDKATGEKRTIYFFDTEDLSLFKQAGTSVILRTRTTKGKSKGETTVKLRAKGTLQIEDEWKQEARNGEKLDFKIEKDQVVTKPIVESYSLDDKKDANAIEEAVEGRQSVKKIFSSNQEDLVEAKAGATFDWDKLEALGPVSVTKWELATPAGDVVAERWDFGKHSPTLEVSTKVDESVAKEMAAKLVAFMRDKGLVQDPDPETKTKEVLQYFASRDD